MLESVDSDNRRDVEELESQVRLIGRQWHAPSNGLQKMTENKRDLYGEKKRETCMYGKNYRDLYKKITEIRMAKARENCMGK